MFFQGSAENCLPLRSYLEKPNLSRPILSPPNEKSAENCSPRILASIKDYICKSDMHLVIFL